MFVLVANRLRRHDQCMNDARPDRERNQAPMLFGVLGSYDQEYSQNGVNADDHLEVVDTFAAMPYPAGWPNNAQRVHKQEDHAEEAQ